MPPDVAENKRLADQLAAMALSVESGIGEAALLFRAAECIDRLDRRSRQAEQMQQYLSSILHDIAVLLAGGQVSPHELTSDPVGMARLKDNAAVATLARIASAAAK